jgi:single-strand DNA-binding protein
MANQGMNKAILIGEVADNPKLRNFATGARLSFRIHIHETEADEKGVKRERHAWHTVIVWGSFAESIAPFLTQGKPVHVEGRLVNRSWQDSRNVRHDVTEIQAAKVVLLGEGSKSNAA